MTKCGGAKTSAGGKGAPEPRRQIPGFVGLVGGALVSLAAGCSIRIGDTPSLAITRDGALNSDAGDLEDALRDRGPLVEEDVDGMDSTGSERDAPDSAVDVNSVDAGPPRAEPFDSPVLNLTANCDSACVVLTNGNVYCWGGSGGGYRFNNGGIGREIYLPRRIRGLRNATQFANSCAIGCGVDGNRDVWCLGDNGADLQTGSPEPYLFVAQRRLDVSGMLQVQPWTLAFLGRHLDGSLYFRMGGRRDLVRFSLVSPVTDIRSSVEYCVLLSNGTVACSYDRDRSEPPRVVDGLTEAAGIAVGARHYCAVKRDGTVWCWGSNEYGQLGRTLEESDRCSSPRYQGNNGWVYPSYACATQPRQVPGLVDVVEVDSSDATTCARKRDGTVWCWGLNLAGLIGDDLPAALEVCPSAPWEPASLTPPPVPCRRRPGRVVGIADATQLAVGGNFACVLRASGGVWCWGGNSAGSLGTGDGRSSPIPIPVPASVQRRDE